MTKQVGMEYTRETSQDNVKMMSRLLVPIRGETAINNSAREQRTKIAVDKDALDKKMLDSVQSRMDASAMMQMLPDIELSKRILIGVILSPKDLYSTEVGFTADAELFGPEIVREFIALVEKYVIDKFDLNSRLEMMLERALFTDGAYPLLVLPENNLDRIINQTPTYNPGLESYARQLYVKRTERPMGFLGFPKASFEHYGQQATTHTHEIFPAIEVCDNINVMKESRVDKSLRKAHIMTMFSQESEGGMTESEIAALYNKPFTATADTQFEVIDGKPTKNSGCPLVETPPASAVIPISTPGRPEHHVGYFVMLNDKGGFVSGEEDRNYHNEIRTRYNNAGKNEASDTIQRVREAMGTDTTRTEETYDTHLATFGPLIEHKLKELLRNGMYDEELDFEFTQNIKSIMFQRAMLGRRTRILFVPKELMTYVAFDYNKDGIGVSLLTKTAIIGSMRMALSLAHNMGQLRNSISRRKVNITLDEDEVDPMKTIGDVQDLILEQSIKSYPLAASNPLDMMRALQLSGYDFAYEGGGPGMPKTKVSFEDWVSQDQGGNPEYMNELRQQHIMGLNLNPELVDPTQSPNFAIEAVNNDMMMSKTVRHLQKAFTCKLTEFAKTFCKFSGDFKRECITVVEKYRSTISDDYKSYSVSEFVDAFLDTLEVTLPSPDRSRTEQQLAAFQQYKDLLETTLEAFISSDIIPVEMLGENPRGTVEQAIAILKAKFLRDWLAENNVMPELGVLMDLDEDDKPSYDIFEIQEPLVLGVVEAMKRYLEKTMPENTGGFGGGDMGGGDAGSDTDDDDFGDSGDDFGDQEEGVDIEGDEATDDLDEDEPEGEVDDGTEPEEPETDGDEEPEEDDV